MTENSTTRTYAENLRKQADFLDSRPEFALDYEHSGTLSFYSRDKFVNAVKALGTSDKKYSEGEYSQLYVTPQAFPEFKIAIARDKVCRKVVKYECEPLFSEAELETL